MAQVKKGLGRGLAALIPNDDMNFLSGVARGAFDMALPLLIDLDSQLEPQKVAAASTDVKASAEGKAAQKRAQHSSASQTWNDASTTATIPESDDNGALRPQS